MVPQDVPKGQNGQLNFALIIIDVNPLYDLLNKTRLAQVTLTAPCVGHHDLPTLPARFRPLDPELNDSISGDLRLAATLTSFGLKPSVFWIPASGSVLWWTPSE